MGQSAVFRSCGEACLARCGGGPDDGEGEAVLREGEGWKALGGCC